MKKLAITICEFVFEHVHWLAGGWSVVVFLLLRFEEAGPTSFLSLDEVFVLAFGSAVFGYFSFMVVVWLPLFVLWFFFLNQGEDDD